MSMFKFDGSGLLKLCKEMEKWPKLVKQSQAATLNDMAFRFKDEAANSIIENFTSRRPDFTKRQMRVQKATVSNMEAVAGSVGAPNSPFTGFVEFLGSPDKRTRAPTIAGRKGNMKNILPQKYRMAPGANFPSTGDMDGGLTTAAKLAVLHRRGVKTFIMPGPEGFPAGLYEFVPGETTDYGRPKVRMVQSFRKPAQPKKFDWINAALSKITEAWVSMTHNKNIEAALMKSRRKL